MTTTLTGKYRSLGTLSEAQLNAAAERFGLGRVIAAQPIAAGLEGNNVALDTETGPWVLRGGLAGADALRRERFFAQAIHERSTVPAPWPYRVDTGSDIFGWPFAVMRRLPGEALWWQEDRDFREVGAAIGEAAAALHALTWPHVGRYSAEHDAIEAYAGTAAEWVSSRLETLIAQMATGAAQLEPASAELVRDAVAGALPSIRDFAPSYVHHDLVIENLLFGRADGGWQVCGVVGLGEGYAADPDEDIVRSLWWPVFWGKPEAAAAFLSAYRARRPARPEQAARLRGYLFLDLLGIWDLGKRLGAPWFGAAATFRLWAEPLAARTQYAIEALVG